MAKKRTRNWATIVYPESAPIDWMTILENLHVPALVSPLHNMDLTTDGAEKKEHYHVVLMFEGVKTREQVQELFEQIGGVGTEAISSLKAYSRYLCHLDNPEKAQYNPDEVLYFSGADYNNIMKIPSSKYTAISEMLEYCIQNEIDSFDDLFIYANENRTDWFQVLCDNGTMPIVQFLKSRYWKIHQRERRN